MRSKRVALATRAAPVATISFGTAAGGSVGASGAHSACMIGGLAPPEVGAGTMAGMQPLYTPAH